MENKHFRSEPLENNPLSALFEERLGAKRLRNFPLFYVNWCYLRPFLKKASPVTLHQFIRQIRAKFQPTFYQYAPLSVELSKNDAPVVLSAKEALPLVSIVTPSFNQAIFLEKTIKSVLNQNYPKLEYYIIDGASQDGSARILSKYKENVTYVESRQDGGQAHAINKGFQRSHGEIMGWVNSDDFLLERAIPFVVEYFLEHPDVDVVYGLRITVDEQDREIGRWIIASQAEQVLPWANYLPQEAVFWRRRIWEKVGETLNESYHFDLDWDLWLRFYQVEAKFARLPRFLGAFRFHENQKTASRAALGRQEAARLHRAYHGRDITWLEVRHEVSHYLWRCSCLYLLYYLGVYRI